MPRREELRADLTRCLILLGLAGCTGPAARDGTRPAVRPEAEPLPKPGRRVPYAPGVTIDFGRLEIELDAEIVLCEGLLELLACSPNTKEHESILRVSARPTHIYEALGLIGLDPGHPARWDEQSEQRIAPTGDPIRIQVSCESGERIDVWDWLRTAGGQSSPSPRPWLFTGSVRDSEGRMVADQDGTVITVVDFGNELIGLAEFHSADNTELWLEAFTGRIPPLDTKCTLVLRRAEESNQVD